MKHAMSSRMAITTLAWASLALTGCGGGNPDAPVGGSLNGLGTGVTVTLQNNGIDNLTLAANQQFSFAKNIPSGSSYNVTVLTQPVGQSCAVANATGSVNNNGDAITNVAVSCTFSSSVGGVVTGLAANNSFTLSTNGVSMQIASNGVFAFPGLYVPGSLYSVVVTAQPSGQICTLTNASGTVAANTLASVTVACI